MRCDKVKRSRRAVKGAKSNKIVFPLFGRKPKELTVGFELPCVSYFVSTETSQAYSGWPERRTYHTDEKLAKEHNFPGLLMQGTLGAAYISQLCTKFFGKAWFTHGKLVLSFTKPVFLPQRVTAKGVVMENMSDENVTKLVLDVWLEDEAGVRVTEGTASCSLQFSMNEAKNKGGEG